MPAETAHQRDEMAAFLAERFILSADGKPLPLDMRAVEPGRGTNKTDVRLRLHADWQAVPAHLSVFCRLFPDDPQHRTYLNLYEGDQLRRQVIFGHDSPALDYRTGGAAPQQGVLAVVGEFFAEGVHHIFIGPDHILFIVGLLLLGGTLKQLLKIVTAFTLAHSVTLALATLGLVTLPARLVEPTIALSIVVVGVHALLTRRRSNSSEEEAGRQRPDARLLFAFGFGLIHGFGFASVLGELDLPRQALGWSLLAFNLGVEAGQACIVLLVAPLLALLHRRSAHAARRIVTAASICVIVAGAFWFVQRVAT